MRFRRHILVSLRRAGLIITLIVGASLSFPPTGVYSQSTAPAPSVTALPNASDSMKIAVLGDFGTATKRQYETASQMTKTHSSFPFELVILVGDNLYGSERPQDFKDKFEIPYKPLLDAGVKFYASLGNHDAREQRYYKPFNMDGRLHYSFKAPKQNIRFFAFESTYPEPEQVAWLDKELHDSKEEWKILFFHHPLYSSGERHGSDTELRDTLEPLILKYGVSIVFTGHDHFYERVKPQKGVTYFVTGSGGQLRTGNIDKSTGITAAGLDTDNAFLVGEFLGDKFTFQAVSRTGKIVDSGTVERRKDSPAASIGPTPPATRGR
jgi:predicted MPP superfamily phosphohydrolase